MEKKELDNKVYFGGDKEEFIVDIENSRTLEKIKIGQECYIKVPGNLHADILGVGNDSHLHIQGKHIGDIKGPIYGFVHELSDEDFGGS